MFSSIALSVLLSLVASTMAMPTNYGRSPAVDEAAQLFTRAVQAPPACAAKAKRDDESLSKRIAQADLPALAQEWQTLCQASGGDIVTNDPCVQLAGVRGTNALLANGGVCDQQNVADARITFAKSPNVTNKDALIANAIEYRRHARNALALAGGLVPSTPFCQEAPTNPELIGIVNTQLPGVNPGLFGGPSSPVVPFGAPGTCPFGQTANVNTCTCA